MACAEPGSSRLADLLTDIAACLCVTLAPDGDGCDGGLCFCGVVGGDSVLIDVGLECDAGCGMGWVRVVSAYPAVSPGEPSDTESTCGSGLGVDIEVGVARCIDGGDDAEGPTGAALQQNALQMADDLMLIRQALSCCDALDNVDYRLGTYTPQGPLGMASGGSWTISVVLL